MNPTEQKAENVQLPDGMTVMLAEVAHLKPLSELFDAYRVVCGHSANRPAAEHFLFERLINHESVIYLAWDENRGRAAGFLMLYPGFSSLEMQPVWFMNDLFVHPDYQRKGIARALVQEALSLVRERGDWGLVIMVAPGQEAARELCDRMGFHRDDRFSHYVAPIRVR